MQFFNEQTRAQALFTSACTNTTCGSAWMCRRKNHICDLKAHPLVVNNGDELRPSTIISLSMILVIISSSNPLLSLSCFDPIHCPFMLPTLTYSLICHLALESSMWCSRSQGGLRFHVSVYSANSARNITESDALVQDVTIDGIHASSLIRLLQMVMTSHYLLFKCIPHLYINVRTSLGLSTWLCLPPVISGLSCFWWSCRGSNRPQIGKLSMTHNQGGCCCIT